jgi:hypothetical protein
LQAVVAGAWPCWLPLRQPLCCRKALRALGIGLCYCMAECPMRIRRYVMVAAPPTHARTLRHAHTHHTHSHTGCTGEGLQRPGLPRLSMCACRLVFCWHAVPSVSCARACAHAASFIMRLCALCERHRACACAHGVGCVGWGGTGGSLVCTRSQALPLRILRAPPRCGWPSWVHRGSALCLGLAEVAVNTYLPPPPLLASLVGRIVCLEHALPWPHRLRVAYWATQNRMPNGDPVALPQPSLPPVLAACVFV